MTTDEVCAARLALDERGLQLQAEQEKLRVNLRLLQRLCGHPNAVRTSHMGESCLHCPDCGNCP